VHLDAKELGDGLGVFVEFALGLEGFQVEAIGFNGFILAEGPDFLHFDFKLYKYNS
jgi:hypothetical protein